MTHRWQRRATTILFAAFAIVSNSAHAAETKTVVIEGMQFQPATLTVHRGDTVIWRNKDLFPHNVTSKGVFRSNDIPANGSWKYVATKLGNFAYICTLHPTMKGTLVVE